MRYIFKTYLYLKSKYYRIIVKRGVAIKKNTFFLFLTILLLISSSFTILGEEESFTYAKKAIKQKAVDVAKQIEIYINSHPDMTVKELQEDEYFQSIAVQQVGKTGYTAVTDYETLTNRFHKNPAIVDLDLHILAEKLPGFWDVMSKTEGGFHSEGIYDWEESDGRITKKYMYIAVIDAKTADGVGLHVAATTYLDEYKEEDFIEKKESNPIVWFIAPILIFMILGFMLLLYRLNIIVFEKNKVMLSLGVALLLIIGLFLLSTYQTTRHMKEDGIDFAIEHLNSISDSQIDYIEYFIEKQKDKIKIAATHQKLTNEELKVIKDTNREFYEVFVLNSQGIIITSSDESRIGMNKSDDAYFINAKDKTYIKPAYYSKTTKRESISVSTPFNRGVLVARIDLKVIAKLIEDLTNLGETGESLLAYRNEDGDAVFFTQRKFEQGTGEVIPKEHTKIPITQALLKNEDVFLDYNDYRDKLVIAVTKYIDEMDIGFVSKVDKKESLENITHTIKSIWYFTIGIIISIMIIAVLFNYFLTKTLKNEVLEKTKEIREKSNQLRHKTNEIKQINVSLEKKVKERTKELISIKNNLDRLVRQKTKDEKQTSSELKIAKRELEKKNKELERTLDDFYTMRVGMVRDMEAGKLEAENKRIKKRLDELKKKK